LRKKHEVVAKKNGVWKYRDMGRVEIVIEAIRKHIKVRGKVAYTEGRGSVRMK
jgi:hypothetical protein